MSIFAKDCPQCAETNPAYALRCRCGFAFGPTDSAAEAEADAELTLQEEKLYQEYLTARAEQAAVAASDAAKVAAAQPANRLKAREAEQAEQAAERAKAELEAQTARLTASMQAAGPSRTQPATEPVSAPRPTTPMKALQSDSPPPPQQQASEVKRNGSPLATALTSPEEDPGAFAKPSSAAAGKGSVGVAPATGAGTRISGAPAPAADGEHADKASTVSSAAVQKPAERADAEPSSQTECNVPAKSAANTGTNRENSASAATSPARPTKTATWLFDNDSPSSNATPGLSAESERAAATGQSANTIAERSTPNANRAATTAYKAEAAARAKKLEEMLKAAQARRLARSERVAPGSAATASKTPPTKTPSKTPASVPTDAPSHPEDTAAKTAGAIDEAKAQTANTEQTTANTPTVAVKKVEELHDAASAGNPISARPAVQPAKATATPKVATQSASATNPEKAARPQATEAASTQANRVNEPASTSATDKAKIGPQAPEAAVPAGQNPNARQELEAALEALEARAPTTPASQTVPATDTNEHAGRTRNDLAASADTPAATDQAEQTPARTPVSPDSTQPPLPADKKDCPNCTTLLPIDAKRCRCGFEFPSNDEKMPALSLSDADVAALEGGIQPSGITRLG